MKKRTNSSSETLAYQPDAVEIEERPVPGTIRWVLYLIIGSIVAAVIGAIVCKVDRIVVAEGELITTAPMIVVQPLSTSVIRRIHVQVGDVVEEGQILVTLDPTFATADLSQLTKQEIALAVQLRRIRAELSGESFAALPEEGEDGKLQERILRQRRMVLAKTKQTIDDKIAALRATIDLYDAQRHGQQQQLKLLRDIEGTAAKQPQTGNDYRLRLLEAQKARSEVESGIDTITAQETVAVHELKQAESDWQRFVEERQEDLLEQEVPLRNEHQKIVEELHKARLMHQLVSLRAPEKGVVLKLAERSVGSIIQQAEPFVTLVPHGSVIEVEVNVESRDIGRIRTGDSARVKLDAFPFQRHDTLPGEVRVISEDAFSIDPPATSPTSVSEREHLPGAFYRTRIALLSGTLRDVPDGFRLMPGMKARAEIKVGTRSVISYFLYPVIRALDEGLREP
ncbi:HlyD family type I secretion periplasmic adaptor subunit [Desulfofustis glycolicus]|uniref:Type I secretion membrane fusion protein, HlyD family n=1 Tax=Desulfofustis glycolicus DSM 9705 TaxID=1121409 RepID=A0A1M5YPC4_9BACT|nr:HlyD family type I secretion periplasmic adaptor subunit [Desulfofustis glycolicus]MCB2217806.1 HlyD family type I secretion periplasmic adaptor subunit [Desulfobulbaceae bacterium]SHI13718.1 type I secretion membrane fusion protein, HlyD family [Desulfofustis glycolicus DSM 9705]